MIAPSLSDPIRALSPQSPMAKVIWVVVALTSSNVTAVPLVILTCSRSDFKRSTPRSEVGRGDLVERKRLWFWEGRVVVCGLDCLEWFVLKVKASVCRD